MRKLAPFLALSFAMTLTQPAMAQVYIHLKGSDPHVRPQDNLYQAVNGGWIQHTKIPGDKRSYGTFTQLQEKYEKDVRTVIEAADAHPNQSHESQMIGDFYSSLMDLHTLDKLGTRPIDGLLSQIQAIRNFDDVARVMATLEEDGVDVPVVAYVEPDEKNPNINAVTWTQAGLGLPDRDYYLKSGSKSAALRQEYLDYLTRLHRLAHTAYPEREARDTLAFETALARIQWTRTACRNPITTYNPIPRRLWAIDYPGFPWKHFAKASAMPASLGAIVSQPSYFKDFADLANKTPIETWKSYLESRVLDAFAPNLSEGFRQAYFQFKSEKLGGLTKMPPRWQRAVETTSDELGEAIGVRYVAKYFPPTAKAQMLVLVHNLEKVYRKSIETLDWMTPPTRQAALQKLNKLRVKIGYPDKWRGYKGLVIRKGQAVENIIHAERFEFLRDMKEAGKPVDKSRWDMTPQTVNAYYNPLGNEIVFPAAILQPPFFDPHQDPAYNYGAIGAVIGHEMSHAYDDQGSHYDAEGRLRDWWTPADRKAFEAKTARLAAQFDAYQPLEGLHVNGRLTLGENIADLTGVTMAYKAYRLATAGMPEKIIDGLTPSQRFFVGFARIWRAKTRPEWLKVRLLSDPHSPEQYRTNGVVTNVDAFYKAFDVKPGDKLYRAPADRVHIW